MKKREIIEFCFRWENNIRQSIYEKKNDRINTTVGGSGGKCRISDPTAVEGIRQAEEVDWVIVEYGAAAYGQRKTMKLWHPEKWLTLVEKVKEHYEGTKYGQLIRLRYMESQPRSVISEELWISIAMVHIMVNNIIEYAEGVADGLQIP